MKLMLRALGTIALAVVTLPAVAHHSFAMFDLGKSTTVEGTVTGFEWTNPHSWIFVTVADANGQTVEWPAEMGPPGGLAHQGWTKDMITKGMKVTMVIHPLKDGKPGGQFVSLTLPDGKQLKNGGTNTPAAGGGAGGRGGSAD